MKQARRPEWTAEQIQAAQWTPEQIAEARKGWDLNGGPQAEPIEPKTDV